MKTFVHTFNTWLIAHLLHPFVFVIYFLLSDDQVGHNWIAAFFFIAIFSFFASIPSLFIAWFLQYVITNTNFSLVEKYIGWMISVVVSIILNFIGLEILFDVGLGEEIYKILPPPAIAALVSILIRYKQFFSLQLNYQSIENENNLV